MKGLGFFLASAAVVLAAPRLLVLSGTLTNTTVEVTAPARLELTIDGEKLTARLSTSPPLTASGVLTGSDLGGWCELRGSLDGGFVLQLRGVLNDRDFRGTYIATPAQGQAQYGRFELARTAPTAK